MSSQNFIFLENILGIVQGYSNTFIISVTTVLIFFETCYILAKFVNKISFLGKDSGWKCVVFASLREFVDVLSKIVLQIRIVCVFKKNLSAKEFCISSTLMLNCL